MAGIDIRHAHSLPPAKARTAVEKVVKTLSERYDFAYAWDGDTMRFNRSGVDGAIDVAPEELHVTAKLGFLLSAMQGTIEKEIRKVLGEKFA